MMFPGTVLVYDEDNDQNITVRMCWDLICGAFEGGSNYWISHIELPGDHASERKAWHQKFSQRARGIEYTRETSTLEWVLEHQMYRYSHQIPFLTGQYLKVIVDGEDEEHILNMDAIKQGIYCMMDGRRHKHDWYSEGWDAITADAFLQYCLFGTVVYG